MRIAQVAPLFDSVPPKYYGGAELSRKRCHEVFEQRFMAARIAPDYVQVYQRLGNGKHSKKLEVCA